MSKKKERNLFFKELGGEKVGLKLFFGEMFIIEAG
jgi:hypothetical protein